MPLIIFVKNGTDETFNIAATPGDTTINGLLDVTGTTSLEGIVTLQNDLIYGTTVRLESHSNTTYDLLEIYIPPTIDSYIGTVSITYIGQIFNGITQENLELFKSEYLIVRFSNGIDDYPIIMKTEDKYLNKTGGLNTPAAPSQYTISINPNNDPAYTEGSANPWTPNTNTIKLRCLAPSRANYLDRNVTIRYEINSGGVTGGPANLSGVWVRS